MQRRDWQTYQIGIGGGDLANFHEYSVDYAGSDVIYRVDNNEVAATRALPATTPSRCSSF